MNIILVISDTFRYDNLLADGPLGTRTPELDRFAGRAVGLSRMYTGSFPTIPHRTDLTTGRFGWPWYGWQSRLASSKNHAPSLLRKAGYVSQLICDCPHLFRADFDKGFDGSCVTRGQEGDIPFLRMNHEIASVMPPEKTRRGRRFLGHNLADLHRWTNRNWRLETDTFPARTASLAVEWLEENYRFEPFFLWVDFFDPHEPWDPPEYMVRRYDPGYSGVPMIHPNYGPSSEFTEGELRNLRAHYAAEAELVDRWVGRVLQKIDDLDLWRNSVVVFTTDHGMSIGEHGRTGKSNIHPDDPRNWPIYPEIAHIPFMIAAPGLEGGRTVGSIVQPADILPTLAELAGIGPEPEEPFHGRSVAGALRGDSSAPARDCAVSASFLRAKEGDIAKAVVPVLYTEKWAYVPVGSDGRSAELYDMEADPFATADVAAENASVAAELKDRLRGWLSEHDAPAEAVAPFE